MLHASRPESLADILTLTFGYWSHRPANKTFQNPRGVGGLSKLVVGEGKPFPRDWEDWVLEQARHLHALRPEGLGGLRP